MRPEKSGLEGLNLKWRASVKPEAKQTNSRDDTSRQSVKDPVCGMTVDPQSAAGSFEYNEQTYFFCNVGCLERFRADPNRFLKTSVSTPPQSEKQSGSAEAEYTWPMQPQIIRDAPGFCPICGMALEPRVVTGEEENAELIDMKRRFWISTTLT